MATSEALPITLTIGAPRVTAGMDRANRLDLRTHLAVHGELPHLDARQLITLAERIALRGRGGAGFASSRKITSVVNAAERRGVRPAVVVNATEGEPGSWKDKMLLSRAPHLILDGATLAARALGASTIVIGVANNGVGITSVKEALRERTMPAYTRIVMVPHRFISGEGGALVRGINGELPIPPGQRVSTSETGVGGVPTLLSNAETYAQLAIAARLGPQRFAEVGTDDEPGTVLLSVGGSAKRPAVVEAPLGVPLRKVLELCQAPIGPAVLTGGFHGAWLGAADAKNITVSHKSLSAAGGSLGAGIMLPLGDNTCALGEAMYVLQYLAGQSSGQCGPCRLGLPDLSRSMASLVAGSGGPAVMDDIRRSAAAVTGRGACSHPDGTARFAMSVLSVLVDDIAAHELHGGCGQQVSGVMPMPVTDVPTRRLAVDWTRCDGHGLCAHLAPELIQLDRNGYPAINNTAVPTWLEESATRAIAMCPALALRFTDADSRAPVGAGSRR